jgi:hypothetical protein
MTIRNAVFGRVGYLEKPGLVNVRWLEGDEMLPARMKDLKRETSAVTSAQIKLEARKWDDASILARFVEGEKIAFDVNAKEALPKNFFEALARSDWRKWVEVMKKELTGWDKNNAVTLVDIADVPHAAKIVPLGELRAIKRRGKYKHRQHLMGNLLRQGKDFDETFSATVSHPGICVFYSLATSCGKAVWRWDAVCGHLQCKEQHDIYAFLPSHQECSSLECEELGKLRVEFLDLMKREGPEGTRKFAAKHKRDAIINPKKALRANSSIYGGPSAGHEFEMIIHGVHAKERGCTQTQPEPSMHVRIVVDDDDVVVGCLTVMAWVDDVRFFGTEPEIEKRLVGVKSKVKIRWRNPL